MHDVFPYDRAKRFKYQRELAQQGDEAPVDEPVEVLPLGPVVHDQGRLTGFTPGGSDAG